MLQPGTQIGRYEVQRKLARGGMGIVYVAHDPVLGRMVAIKVFLGDLDVPDAAERFAREARAAASLNHANIVTVYDFGEVASQPYIVMEYLQGDTLAEIIKRRTPVPIPEKIRWLEEVCAGAASAHKMDVVHRDIKPSNLLIDRSGRLKILDFGIAKIVNSLATSMTAVIGTPGYMAPEQLLGHPVDARTDIFAIGVVGYELLTYEEAFAGDSFTAVTQRIVDEDVRPIPEIVPDVPPDLCEVIDKRSTGDRPTVSRTPSPCGWLSRGCGGRSRPPRTSIAPRHRPSSAPSPCRAGSPDPGHRARPRQAASRQPAPRRRRRATSIPPAATPGSSASSGWHAWSTSGSVTAPRPRARPWPPPGRRSTPATWRRRWPGPARPWTSTRGPRRLARSRPTPCIGSSRPPTWPSTRRRSSPSRRKRPPSPRDRSRPPFRRGPSRNGKASSGRARISTPTSGTATRPARPGGCSGRRRTTNASRAPHRRSPTSTPVRPGSATPARRMVRSGVPRRISGSSPSGRSTSPTPRTRS